MGERRTSLAIAATLALTVLVPLVEGTAHGYEFEVRARTVGQGYELRRLGPGSISLVDRRRFTQTLSLNIWDLASQLPSRKLYDTRLPTGPNLYFTTYMRLDHDFGDWTGGDLMTPMGATLDALDLIPELEQNSLNLDVLFAYFAAEDLPGGIDLYAGRMLEVDSLEWWSFDGAKVVYEITSNVAVEAYGGLRIRDDSILGSAVYELDGTGSAECAEYVEGSVPGSGAWRPIDLEVPGENNPFANDYDFCPQREELQPTFGVAVEGTIAGALWARASYRRTVSQEPGIIGPVDRFDNPDTGFYPDEAPEAPLPTWLVNEEKVTATVRYQHEFADGKGRVDPYAAARYSVLHGLFDEGHVGVKFRYGMHIVEPEAFYLFPTFDGDSIFNVFAAQGYWDYRLGYEIEPLDSLRAYVRPWLRVWDVEDQDVAALPMQPDLSELSGGVQSGVRYVVDRDVAARLDLFYDDGYGGRQAGGYTSVRWRIIDPLGVAARVSIINYADDLDLADATFADGTPGSDLRATRDGTTYGLQAGVSYEIIEGITVHALAEENINRLFDSQFRLIGIVDLAFHPDI